MNLDQMTAEAKEEMRSRLGHHYEESIETVQKLKDEFYRDLFSDNEHVLDTDYKRYVTFFSCQEVLEEVN